MARGDTDGTTVVDLPFAGGLQEQTESAWLDGTRGQTSIVNGNFTYAGSLSKRLGAKFVAQQALGAGNSSVVTTPAQGLRAMTWSRGQLAMAGIDNNGSGALYSAQPPFLNTSYKSIGPLPQCRTLRRGLPVVYSSTLDATSGNFVPPVSAFTPVVVDAAGQRFVFYAEGAQTWCLVVDIATGETVGVPFVIYSASAASVITPVVTPTSVEILLQIAAGPGLTPSISNPASMVGVSITNLANPWGSVVVSSALNGIAIYAADMCPYVGDPAGGFILFYAKTADGTFRAEYFLAGFTATTTLPIIDTEGNVSEAVVSVAAVYTAGTAGLPSVGFWYNYHNSVSDITSVAYAACNGDHTFVRSVAPVVIATPNPLLDSTVTDILYAAGTFIVEYQNAESTSANASILSNVNTVQCRLLVLVAATGAVLSNNALPIGLWPVGRMFLAGATEALCQPFVMQLGSLASDATPGSNSATQSQQCTLYLCELAPAVGTAYPISTAAVRQVDPLFSWQWWQFPTGSLPRSSVAGTLFALGVRTTGASIPGAGLTNGASWYVTWDFGADAQALLWQSNEVAGALHVSGSSPFVCDGTQTFEDGFFAYPEFAVAGQTATGVTSLVTGQYGYAVQYVAVDATGALQRSAPVFCEDNASGTALLTVTNGGNLPQVSFPPLPVSYRNVLYPGSVTAEIYRTQKDGGTYFLLGTTPAYPVSASTFGIQGINPTAIGHSYGAPPTVSFTGGGGSGGGAATAVLGGGQLTAITVTANGVGYTAVPNVVITPTSGGSGAKAVAITGWLAGPTTTGVIGVKITNPGSGYASAPNISFTGGGGGTGAAASAAVSVVGVTSYIVTVAGNYATPPTVVLTPTSGGTGATATAVLAPGTSSSVNINFVDAFVTDAELGTSTVLYTTGNPGPVDQVNPPAALVQCVHWNRKWIVDETGTGVWFTTQFVTGEAPRFNEALYFSYPDGGDITAMAGMDDKLVLFKQNSVSVVFGQGPANNGQGSDLTQPQKLATDSGAIDWRSVVLMPSGLMFQSKTGIYLLDRNLSVTWIGRGIKDTLAAFPVVLSSCLVPTATQVRFVCQAPSGETAVLVYDYLANSWLTHAYNAQSAPLASCVYATIGLQSPGGDIVASGTYALVGADGSMWREQDAANETADAFWKDQDLQANNYFVPTSTVFSWVKQQGVQGYQRARRVLALTEMQDPAGISVSVALNYDSQIVQSALWTDGVVQGLPIPQVEMHVAGAYNKQQSIQVSISDVGGPLAVTGQGARFVVASLELQHLGSRWPGTPSQGRA